MANPTTLSVILPNYNHSQYISEALDAILNQSFSPLEIIVIDDASTDNSLEVISRYTEKYPFIKLIKNEFNRGHLISASDAVKFSRGTYLHFHAADDKTLPGLYEESMHLFTAHPQAGLCSTLAYSIDKDGKEMGLFATRVIRKEPTYISPAEAFQELESGEPWFVGSTTIWRRDCIIAAGLFLPELGNYADAFLCRVIALKYGACYIPKVLGTWRRIEKGYANSLHSDIGKQIDIVLRAAQLLKIEPYVSWVPHKHARRWVREWLFNNLLRVIDKAETQCRLLTQGKGCFSLSDKMYILLFRLTLRLVWVMSRLHHILYVRQESFFDTIKQRIKKTTADK